MREGTGTLSYGDLFDCAGNIYLSRGPERQVHFTSVFNGRARSARCLTGGDSLFILRA